MLTGQFFRFYGWLPKPIRVRLVRFLKPSYTVGSIPFITRSDGRILLVRHSYKQGWATPGGFVNRGEAAAVGAVREAWEEVGLRVEVTSEPTVVIDPVGQRVEVVFRGRPAAGADPDAAAPRSQEIIEVGWFEPDALPPLQDETREGYAALLAGEAGPDATGRP
jgi:ADP-ribose pyrophosphatase YjhB (NUDIX family)